MPCPDRASLPVLAARWAALTSAQSIAPSFSSIRTSNASRTAGVRPQMPPLSPLGLPIASADGGPSLAPVRVAITRTVYRVALASPVIVWLVVEPEAIVACRSVVL